MQLTNEMKKAAMQAKSVEELIEMAKKQGIPLTEEKAKKIFVSLNVEGELSDDELENVAGGGCYSTDPHGNLIVTVYNSCDGWEEIPHAAVRINGCTGCKHHWQGELALYCSLRTRDNDPYA